MNAKIDRIFRQNSFGFCNYSEKIKNNKVRTTVIATEKIIPVIQRTKIMSEIKMKS